MAGRQRLTLRSNISYETFLDQVERGDLAPIYLLLGTESFLVQEALALLVESVLDPTTREFNLDKFYGDEADPTAVVNAALAYPVLASKRVVVLRNLDKLSESALRALLPIFEHPSDTTCLILTAEKVDKARKTLAALVGHCVTVDCSPLYERQVPAWIDRRASCEGKQITREAADLLLAQVGSSLRDLANEIQKLLIFLGDRQSIEASDVREVVGTTRMNSIFELTGAIGNRRTLDAIRMTARMLDEGEKPTRMISMILRDFGIMVKIKSYQTLISSKELSQKVGVSPFFLKEYVRQSGLFSAEMLTQGIQHLREADSNLKSGYQNDRTIMELLVYRLCRL